MWNPSKRPGGRRRFTSGARITPVWGHPARHEDDWPAQRNRELVQLLALTSHR